MMTQYTRPPLHLIDLTDNIVSQAPWRAKRAKRQPDAKALIFDQRRRELKASIQVTKRLVDAMQVAACAYGVSVLWLGGERDTQRQYDQSYLNARRDYEELRARLRPARQYPLVLGDPERRTIWLDRSAFEAMLEHAHQQRSYLHVVDASGPYRVSVGSGEGSGRSGLFLRLAEDCEPAARLVLAQTEALVGVAPRIAICPPNLRGSRYVVVAPMPSANARLPLVAPASVGEIAARILCVPVRSRRRDTASQ